MVAVCLPSQTLGNGDGKMAGDRIIDPLKPKRPEVGPKSVINPANVESDRHISSKGEAWMESNLDTKELDIAMMKKANVHPGPRDDDLDIDLEKTWKSLVMAATVVVGVENPKRILVASDIMMINGDIDVPEMVEYFVDQTGSEAFTRDSEFIGDLPPRERPKLLILTYPKTEDHLCLIKAAHVAKIPMIAFCEIDCPMEFVDDANNIIIPANCNESAVSCLFWLLGRMVLQMRGLIPQGHPWERFEDPDPCYWDIEECKEEGYNGRRYRGEEEEKDCTNNEDEEEDCWEVERGITESDFEDTEDCTAINWVEAYSEECQVVEAWANFEVVVHEEIRMSGI